MALSVAISILENYRYNESTTLYVTAVVQSFRVYAAAYVLICYYRISQRPAGLAPREAPNPRRPRATPPRVACREWDLSRGLSLPR